MRYFLHERLPIRSIPPEAARAYRSRHRLRVRTLPDEEELCQWRCPRFQTLHKARVNREISIRLFKATSNDEIQNGHHEK